MNAFENVNIFVEKWNHPSPVIRNYLLLNHLDFFPRGRPREVFAPKNGVDIC